MAEITIIIDAEGNADTTLKGFEEESPKIAALFEKALGKTVKVDWKPGNHSHLHLGHGGHHHH